MVNSTIYYTFVTILFILLAFLELRYFNVDLAAFFLFVLYLASIMIFQISTIEKRSVVEHKGKKAGMSGWLLFFTGLIFIVGLSGAISNLIALGQSLTAEPFMELWMVSFYAVSLCISIALAIAGTRLWLVKRSSLRFALWILGIYALQMLFYAIMAWSDTFFGYGGAVLFSVMTILILLLMSYFKYSERSINTFTGKSITSTTSNTAIYVWLVIILLTSLIMFI